jgi:FAD/FMN-containing dehydrogenase/short-subunit dehydrogenase
MKLTNWGLFPVKDCNVFDPNSYEELAEIIKAKSQTIARGNGRCYGDASLAKNTISTLQFDSIISLDEMTGFIHCQSGVLLSSILDLVVPKGFFLPVTPGTKFITIGGAFASDIHGKNHHKEGVFSDHVSFIKLMNEAGELITLFPNDDLFQQTAGGMGLTGIIVEVSLKLKRIESNFIKQIAIRANNLEEIFALFEKHANATYSVAWIDSFAKGPSLGKSVLLLGEHAAKEEAPNSQPISRINFSIPFYFPSWMLHPILIRIFNWLYYNKPSSNGTQIVHYDDYFYPLDKILHWNRIYGKKGFIQYQFVLPKNLAYEGLKSILAVLADNQMGSFLAVLKLFGTAKENRFLHFPIHGYTLALDIKINPSIWNVLDQLDTIVTNYGGKIYLTKDARLKHEQYLKQYPNQIIETNKFQSFQSERLQTKHQEVLLVLGASSDIAQSIILAFVKKYPSIYLILASTNIQAIESFVSTNHLLDKTTIQYFDASQTDSHKTFVKELPYPPKWILYASGILVDNNEVLSNSEKLITANMVNFVGAVSILNELINVDNQNLERIIGLSSIAGLRGRKANFMYGAAKAGFHAYLFGLRQFLKDRNILVQAVTPGFVTTKMTAHLPTPKNAVNPDIIANAVIQSSNEFEIYPNLYWKIIGNLVKIFPEWIIRRI